MEFCDYCDFLDPKEWEQSDNSEPHICKKYRVTLKHEGCHPKIPKPEICKKGAIFEYQF